MIDVSVQAGALARGGDVHGDVRIRPGGSAANAAVWAAAEGALVTLVGRVGDDAMGRMLSEALRERGVETALAVDAQARTGTMLVVHQANERSMVADRGANACLRADDLPKEMTADAVLVSGYLLFAEGSEAAALAALERADAPIVAVEASSWPLLQAYGPERFLAVTSRASLLLANEREAEVLFGPDGVDGPARQMDRGLRVAIKRGPKGALLVGWGKALDVPAPSASEAVDPTGAGDAFDGVLIAALAAGLSIELALERAVAAGSRVAANHDTWPEP
jgi:sugar/nucleoside kinase (ribokinase family)